MDYSYKLLINSEDSTSSDRENISQLGSNSLTVTEKIEDVSGIITQLRNSKNTFITLENDIRSSNDFQLLIRSIILIVHIMQVWAFLEFPLLLACFWAEFKCKQDRCDKLENKVKKLTSRVRNLFPKRKVDEGDKGGYGGCRNIFKLFFGKTEDKRSPFEDCTSIIEDQITMIGTYRLRTTIMSLFCSVAALLCCVLQTVFFFLYIDQEVSHSLYWICIGINSFAVLCNLLVVCRAKKLTTEDCREDTVRELVDKLEIYKMGLESIKGN